MIQPEGNLQTVSKLGVSSTIEILTQIWERHLQLRTIGPADNFFELGGDSATAVQIFAEIAQTCGQQLPAVMIYQVPTIAAQAALIEGQSAPQFSPIIPLKSGSEGTPIFVASGLGGGPAEFFQLVKFVNSANPIYGLQPKGIEGFDSPCNRIEEMADYYLKAILQFQASGPYILIGYSLGGLVALEMARALKASGREIAHLVMIDSYPDINFLSPAQRVLLAAQRLTRRAKSFGRSPSPPIRLGGLPSADAISTFAPSFQLVRDAAYQALRAYQPRFYSGKLKFIRASEITEFPSDPRPVWSELVGEFEVETVSGDHFAMLSTHCEELATVLDKMLAK